MWKQPDTLPEKGDDERFTVYLAFDDRSVRLADWVSWTKYQSEYHNTGAYLGQYPYDGDCFYSTECGFEVRKEDDGGKWFSEKHFEDGTKEKFYVVGWMEALRPVPEWETAEVYQLDDHGIPIQF